MDHQSILRRRYAGSHWQSPTVTDTMRTPSTAYSFVLAPNMIRCWNRRVSAIVATGRKVLLEQHHWIYTVKCSTIPSGWQVVENTTIPDLIKKWNRCSAPGNTCNRPNSDSRRLGKPKQKPLYTGCRKQCHLTHTTITTTAAEIERLFIEL